LEGDIVEVEVDLRVEEANVGSGVWEKVESELSAEVRVGDASIGEELARGLNGARTGESLCVNHIEDSGLESSEEVADEVIELVNVDNLVEGNVHLENLAKW